MGCCGSTQAGDNDRPPPSAAATPAAPPVTTSPIAPPSTRTRTPRSFQTGTPAQPQSPSRSLNRARHQPGASLHTPNPDHVPSHERYNTPLQPPPPWTCTTRTWTPTQLHRERAEFFDTRVTGRPEIWGALHNVCELVRGGDVATAQGMLDAAGITLPTENLVDGCYDEVGNLYRLPELVVSDPVNIRRDGDGRGGEREEREPDPEEEDEVRVDDRSRNSNNIDGETMIGVSEPKVVGAAAEKVVDGEEKDVEKESEEILGRRREEKGKGSERDAVKVRCRLSDRGGPDVVIVMGKTQHVGTLARRVQSEGDVSQSFHVRLAYLGKILSEKDTLEAQGWKEGHVVNALVVGGVDVPGS